MNSIFLIALISTINNFGYRSIDCPNVLEEFSNCKRQDLLFYSKEDWSSRFLPQIQCHFPNQVTLFAYIEDEEIRLDAKGDQLQEFTTPNSCEELSNTVNSYSRLPVPQFETGATSAIRGEDSVLVVSSQLHCNEWQKEISELVEHYKSEGRKNSRILCVADSVVRTQNPSQIRRLIQKSSRDQQGILLLGEDLPTFEIFHRTGYTGDWAAYAYGQTDLPYGDDQSSFWGAPLSKTSSALRNRVYHDVGYMYKTYAPTPFSYDLDSLVQSDLSGAGIYRQKKWVSRWMGTKTHLQNFIKRRRNFQIHRPLRVTYASGAEGVFWRPHESESFDRYQKTFRVWKDLGVDFKIYAHTDLEHLTKNLDRDTDLLIQTEHGQPEAIGNLHASEVGSFDFLPQIVHYDTCLGGAYGYADEMNRSLIYQSFKVSRPPVVILASGGIKWMRTVGEPDIATSSVFLDPMLALDKNFGARQIEAFDSNWQYWRANRGAFWNRNPSAFAHQIFINLGLFGDGSVEL